MRSYLLLTELFLSSFLSFACSSTPPETTPEPPSIEGLNAPCDTNEKCMGDLACGGPGESQGQCVMSCPSLGAGPTHGCPEEAFCYVFDHDDGHYCTRTCSADTDCTAVNPALVCKASGGEDEQAVKICVLP